MPRVDPHLILSEGDAKAGVRPYEFDDLLIQSACETGHVRWSLYQPSRPMVVVGRSSRLDREVDLERCIERRIPLYRRYGGGCSVILDPGNLVISLVFPTATRNTAQVGAFYSSKVIFEQATGWVIEALHELGVTQARREGTSDLVVGDRKIGGACIYQTKSFIYFSTTILVEPDIATIAACLLHPPREPDYRCGRGHASFLMGIGALVGDKAPVVAGNLHRILERRPLELRPLSVQGPKYPSQEKAGEDHPG